MNKDVVKLLAVFACLLWTNCMNCQPRVNGGTKAQVLKTSPAVTNIVGWYYSQEHQKWCGSYNVIGGGSYNNSMIPKRLTPNDMAVYESNVISLQVKKVKFEEDIYYLLLVPYYKGRYEYPAIEVGWYSRKVTNVYVFTQEEFEKLKSLKEGITTVSPIHSTSYGGGVGGFGYCETFSSAMVYLFKSKEDLHKYRTKYYLYLKKEDDKIIRFQDITNRELEFSQDQKNRFKVNFNFSYYEISANLFEKILL